MRQQNLLQADMDAPPRNNAPRFLQFTALQWARVVHGHYSLDLLSLATPGLSLSSIAAQGEAKKLRQV